MFLNSKVRIVYGVLGLLELRAVAFLLSGFLFFVVNFGLIDLGV